MTRARAVIANVTHSAVRPSQLNEHLQFAQQGTVELKRRLLCKVMEMLVRAARCACARVAQHDAPHACP